ncbi:HAD family hydrolase [Candidatus Dojkabacteria bacterium]|jgi:HAD superfamily hydrolase (TIGR01509 family)|nr:HAD family hydrolase [Candidatus Dojkabacteria bacterium]
MDENSKDYQKERLVIFDMIGTLTSNPHLISQILHLMLPNKSIDLIRREYWNYQISRISKSTFWENIGISNYEEFEERFLSKILFKAGVLEMATRMKRDSRLAILSNIPSEWGSYLVEKFKLRDIFEEIVFSGDYGIKKPKPELYNILLKKFPNADPKQIFFVDDDIEDLITGARFNMKTIWLKSGRTSDSFTPDYIIEDILEIEELIRTSNR